MSDSKSIEKKDLKFRAHNVSQSASKKRALSRRKHRKLRVIVDKKNS